MQVGKCRRNADWFSMQAFFAKANKSRHFMRLPLGLLLLVVWGAWSVANLAAVATAPAADSAESIRDRLLAFAPYAPTPGQAVAFRLRVPGCDCATPVLVTLPGIRSVDLRDRPAPQALPYPLIVFDTQARLIYAGPAQFAGCGTRIAAASLIPQLLTTSGSSPLISPAQCDCPTELKEPLV